ncbi:unnamed protein product, partial [Prunus brigantina]
GVVVDCKKNPFINNHTTLDFSRDRSTILVIASLTPYIIRRSLLEQRIGAPPKIHHLHHH